MGIIKYFEYLVKGASSIEDVSSLNLDIFYNEGREDNDKYYKTNEESIKEEYQKTCKNIGKIVLDK